MVDRFRAGGLVAGLICLGIPAALAAPLPQARAPIPATVHLPAAPPAPPAATTESRDTAPPAPAIPSVSLDAAARSRMHECGHQWSAMKKAGTVGTLTWKDFSATCLVVSK